MSICGFTGTLWANSQVELERGRRVWLWNEAIDAGDALCAIKSTFVFQQRWSFLCATFHSMANQNNCDGACLKQCVCDCYERIDPTIETDDDASDSDSNHIESRVCTCGHREHGGICPSPNACCKPVKCRAYSVCGGKARQRDIYVHQGCCGANCAIRLGPLRKTDEVGDCPICVEQEELEELKCGHKMCFECWNRIAEHGKQNCPMCRRTNDWSGS